MNPNTKMLFGALVAAGLAIAVYYGLISQQSASSIQTQANQTLGTAPPASQPSSSADVQNPMPPATMPPQTAPQAPTTPRPAPATPTPAPQH